MADSQQQEVLHYLGYDDDRGGIVSVVRALATARRFRCVLGLNRRGVQRREPALPEVEFAPIEGERIGLASAWSARRVAREARAWLAQDSRRVFHGHSRAGLLVALWLARAGERRVVASVHCYGRQRWFYRWAVRQLEGRLFWLSPAMKRHYHVAGVAEDPWANCIPGCVSESAGSVARRRDDGALRLGGVGAVTPWKGWHLVLEAMARLPASARARVQFEHVGATASRANLKYARRLHERTEQLGLQHLVRWRGEQPSVESWWSEIDVLVVASRAEPFSVAMLEALQAGVPVLAADTGGATDVIRPGVNGWLFRSGSASDLSRAIAMLLESQARQCVQPAAGWIAPFAAARIAERWSEVYAGLLRSAAGDCD